MKIAFINGVNEYENQAFLETLNEAYDSLNRTGEILQIQVVDPNLLELYRTFWDLSAGGRCVSSDDYYEVELAISSALRQVIQDLDASGEVQGVVVPLGAQLIFPCDYILDDVGCEVFYVMYYCVRHKILELAEKPSASSNILCHVLLCAT